MTYKLTDIKAISPEFVTKLNTLNIHTTDDLLKVAGDGKALQAATEKTGLNQALMDRFLKISQLTKVEGVTPQHAELLFWAGVDSFEKLREQKPDALLRKLTEVNTVRKLNVPLPPVGELEKWTKMAPETETIRVR